VPRGCQLGVRLREGALVAFNGFRDADFATLAGFVKDAYGTPLREQTMSTNGARAPAAEPPPRCLV
jgi:hypothetical protein